MSSSWSKREIIEHLREIQARHEKELPMHEDLILLEDMLEETIPEDEQTWTANRRIAEGDI